MLLFVLVLLKFKSAIILQLPAIKGLQQFVSKYLALTVIWYIELFYDT